MPGIRSGWRRLLAGCALAFVALAAPGQPASTPEVCIILADDSPQYRETADAIAAELAGRAVVRRLQAAHAPPQSRERPAFFMGVGVGGFERALMLADGAPIVATLLVRGSYERALRAAPAISRNVSAVFLDQPPNRQLALIRAILPNKNRVAVLAGGGSSELLGPLRSAAREQRVNLIAETAASATEIYPALKRLLDESDALLAVPDPGIYNAGTIHNIVASAVRAQLPVFGFAPAYVRAGAVASVYSTPAQVGKQAGEVVARALAGTPLASPQYPRVFSVSTNPAVASALGIALDDEPAIIARIQRLERAE